MITLQELKNSIEDRTFKPSSFVIVCEDKFIPLQYVRAIERGIGYKINYLETLEALQSDDEMELFYDDSSETNDLNVFNTEVVDICTDLVYNNNVMVICNKISKDAKKYYSDILIEIPKLVEWQLQDMVYSYGKGVERDKLDWLMKHCGNDVNRLYSEMSKLALFSEAERPILFDLMVEEGAFSDVSSKTIFELTRAVAERDSKALYSVYKELDNIDTNEFGLLAILYKNFMNVFQIQIGISTSSTSLGISPGQFYAIKKHCGKYTNAQLVQIVDFLTDIDRKVKTGELDTKIMMDYMILSILSF